MLLAGSDLASLGFGFIVFMVGLGLNQIWILVRKLFMLDLLC